MAAKKKSAKKKAGTKKAATNKPASNKPASKKTAKKAGSKKPAAKPAPAAAPAAKAKYVDGFVLPVPEGKLDQYRALAKKAGSIWREHGALEYREAIGQDLNTECGVPFPRLAQSREGENVIFSWITYKSRAHRDAVNEKVMADPRLKMDMTGEMPFDMARMTYGGFEILVDA